MSRCSLLATLLLAPLLAAAPARLWALDLAKQYEEELIRWALAQAKLQRDPDPEGKLIERIEIVREKIVARSDPWPSFVNYFHMTTRDFVVRQEILVAPDDRWDAERIEEGLRNLRRYATIAAARAVACRSSRAGHVVLLVLTKDLWSIRLNTNFDVVGSVVHFFEFFPSEENFLGRNKRIGLHLRVREADLSGPLLRDQLSLGQTYVDYRLLGSRWRLTEWLDLILAGRVPCGGALDDRRAVWCPNLGAGSLEGAYAVLQLDRPLYSVLAEWSFSLWGELSIRQVRSFIYNSGDPPPGEIGGLSLRTASYDAPDGQLRRVPRVFDMQVLRSSATITRSFGLQTKHDFTAGLRAVRELYRLPQGFPFDDDVRRRFTADFLPRGQDLAYLVVAYETRDPRFFRTHNLQTFALSEDIALGHDVLVEAHFASDLQDPSHGYCQAAAMGQYRWKLRDDLLTVWLAASARWQPDTSAFGMSSALVNRLLDVGINNVTPSLWIGRLHLQARGLFRGYIVDRYTTIGGVVSTASRTLNAILDSESFALGGISGLRGYAAAQFEGRDILLFNAEYRTRPLNFFSIHLGLVLFYDGGAVFGGPDPKRPERDLELSYHHAVGLGLRANFPQFDKIGARIDLGFPLSGDRGGFGTWLSLSWGQVFF